MTRYTSILIAALALSFSCGKKQDESAAKSAPGPAESASPAKEEEEILDGLADEDGEAGGTGTKMALSEGKMGRSEGKRKSGQYAMKGNTKSKPKKDDKSEVKKPAGASEVAETQSRSWFPETFLFEPLVVTDASGTATVTAVVPDRLTSWRVLALAHARNGRQSGAVTSFLGTLETYVEVVVPPVLRVGDRAEIPVQVVNTTAKPVRANLTIKATGASVSGGGETAVAAGSSSLQYARLAADQPGDVQLLARLEGADAVTRTLRVEPTGRPLISTRSGTLAAPRSFELPFADETKGSFARLSVYSGARALLTEELALAASRGGVENDAFALLLIGQAPELLGQFSMEIDTDALRKSRILLTQRAVRHARVMSLAEANLLARATQANEGDPVLASIAVRARAKIAESQLPDGTCGGSTGWTLQRLLVSTADCTRAAEGERQVMIRASGAFERNAKLVDDPYTAASLLATKAGSEEARAAWMELVEKAVKGDPAGGKIIEVPGDVKRTDGLRPSAVEATAMAVLALEDGPLRNDLGATVLGRYRPGRGWGDGQTNLVCMQAVIQLFSKPLPSEVQIELLRDGETVATGTIDPKKAGEVFVLEARDPRLAGSHKWQVKADPAVPGLAFAFESKTFGPWPAPPKGLEIAVTPPPKPKVGQPATIAVRAQIPAQATTLTVGLPAGVMPDTAALDAQVSAGTITSFEVVDGRIKVELPSPKAGRALAVSIPVVPTLAGRLSTGAVALRVGSEQIFAPPSVWNVVR